MDDTEEILNEMNVKEEDEITVCELFDQYTRKGINMGISQGIGKGIIIMCKDFAMSYEETAEKLCKKLNISEEQAQKEMQLYW